MNLTDYTTKELLEELLRRENSGSSKSTERNMKPIYAEVIGTVSKVHGAGGPFARKRWEIEVSDEDAEKYHMMKTSCYKLLGGRFNKDNHPRVGDNVVLRSRITKMRPVFSPRDARISEYYRVTRPDE